MAKLRVGVVFGGRSGEHEISLVSAAGVMAALDRSKYEIVPIGITRMGRWVLGRGESTPAQVLLQGTALTLPPQPGGVRRLAGRGPAMKLDVLLPILHGPLGEDGAMQGFLELTGIPYLGAGVLGSAVAMDKDVMKRLFLQAGLPVGPHLCLDRRRWEQAPGTVTAEVEKRLRYPVFVKPANLGSSVGISKAHHRAELGPAVELAAGYDAKIVVEQGIEGRELECAVLGNDPPAASVPGEIIPGREFYDYEAKYAEAGSRTMVPAPIGARLSQRVQQLAIRAFQATEGRDLARVDFFLEKASGKLWLNEINTMPGFTPISMFPKLWQASGLPFPALLDRLIGLTLDRARERSRWDGAGPRSSTQGRRHGEIEP